MKRHNFAGTFRQWQGDGQAVNLPRLAFEIGQAVADRQYAAVIEGDLTGQTQAGLVIFGSEGQGLSLLRYRDGTELWLAIPPLAVAFNARRAEQTVTEFSHKRDRRINIQSAVGNRAGKRFRILRRKVAKVRPPVKNFGERMGFDHHINRFARES